MNNRTQYFLYALLLFTFIGIADAAYLTYEHYSNIIPPCVTGFAFIDCGKVLKSVYAQIGGIPLAILGIVHYATFCLWIVLNTIKKNKYKWLIFIQAIIGFIASLGFVYLQVAVIKAICFYCMISAVNSLILFILATLYLKYTKEQN